MPAACPYCGQAIPHAGDPCPGCGGKLGPTEPAGTRGQKQWIVGADRRCDIVVPQSTVSGRHCRLTQTPDGCLLEDLNSRNGTFVNGRRIDTAVPVSRDDTITLGQSVPLPWPDLHSVAPAETIRIGRLPENDIVLDYPMVSGFHARILSTAGEAWIEDLGSTNGTAIGSLDNKTTRAPLSPDEAVFFGSLRIPASRLLGDRFDLGSQPFTAVQVKQQEIVLGREPGCDVLLDDPQVSRRHARVIRSQDQVFVEDLGSTNGTFVNGQRIKGRQQVQAGDVITMGSHTFTVTADGNLEQRDWRGNVAIEARGVAVAIAQKQLLDKISLTIYPSEFVGLMGPSGAGKTTLMNALNGYTPPSSGSVMFNGKDLYTNFNQFRGLVGYVPQDDIMHGDLTVGQALCPAFPKRLNSSIPRACRS